MSNKTIDQNQENLEVEKEVDKNSTITIEQVIKMQDTIMREVDISKSDDELTPDGHVKKLLYKVLDEQIEETMGKEFKNNLDNYRKISKGADILDVNGKRLAEIAKELETTLIWQRAGLDYHLNRDENEQREIIDRISDDLVSGKNTKNKNLELAGQAIDIINAYESKLLGDLKHQQKKSLDLINLFDDNYKESPFDDFSDLVLLKGQFNEYIELSRELLNGRKIGVEAVSLFIEIDKIIPKLIIDNKGDSSVSVDGSFKMKTDQVIKFFNESREIEDKIWEKRKALVEKIFGNYDDFLKVDEVVKDTEVSHEVPKIDGASSLESKVWYRLCKVIYIGLYALSLLFGVLLMSDSGDIGLYWVFGTIFSFWLLKKAFLYIVFGRR